MSRGKKGKKLLAPPRAKNRIKKKKGESEEDRVFKEVKYVGIVIELMKKGFSTNYIKSHLMEDETAKISTLLADCYVREANSTLSSEYSIKTKSVEAIHVARYNKTINKLLLTKELDRDMIGDEGGISYDDWIKARNWKIKKFDECLDTMWQKEKCMQMFSKTFVIQINEEVEVNEKKQEIDIAKLTFSEQVEMLELFKKSKKGEDEIASVSESLANKSETVDAIAEVVETKINVDDIKHEKPKDQLVKPELITDPTAKLRATLAKLAEAKLTKKNPTSGIEVIEVDPK